MAEPLGDAIRADLLEHAVDAAFAAEVAYARDRKPDGGGHRMPTREQVRRLVAAAAPIIEGAGRQRLYAELGNDHYVTFADDGWTVEHSVECRLSGHMHDQCAYWDALKHSPITSYPDPEMHGRWRIDGIDSEGLPSLVRAEMQGEPS